MLSMANVDQNVIDLLNYRFKANTELESHSIKNLMLAALLDMNKDFTHSLPVLSKMLNIKGRVLPITEENVALVGITEDGTAIVGEENITKNPKVIDRVKYDKKVKMSNDIKKAINGADLIIFSSGSLLTSITPNLVIDGIVETINESKAKKMYICNLVTQPGETDGFKVSDHINYLEKYLGKNTIDVVVANDAKISSYIAKKYSSEEQKDPVILDDRVLNKMNVKIIRDKIWKVEDGVLRHDSLKTSYLIFSYLMDGE